MFRMPIPVCFMVMPFGKKLTHAEGDKVPSQIDFDLLWDKVLRPMIQDGLKHIPVRADQDVDMATFSVFETSPSWEVGISVTSPARRVPQQQFTEIPVFKALR
jgi:hypothetical protein